MNEIVTEHKQDFDMVYEVRTTSRDIEMISSCIAIRKMLSFGWEVADLNNLEIVIGDDEKRFVGIGGLKFLKSKLADPLNKPRLNFWHSLKSSDEFSKFQYRCSNKVESKIPIEVARLILKMLPKQGNHLPIDYLVRNPEGYTFVELKANKARLSEKQLKISKMIRKAGYKVMLFHVSLNFAEKATLNLSYID